MLCDHFILDFLNDPRCAVYDDGSIQNIRGFRHFGYLNNHGYRIVKYKNFPISVARIVCSYFYGFEDGLCVNHKDGNKQNNKPENLEWVTYSENQIHSYRVLKKPAVRGNKKINMEIANSIRKDKNEGLSLNKLTEKYNLAKSTISYIVNNRTWKA